MGSIEEATRKINIQDKYTVLSERLFGRGILKPTNSRDIALLAVITAYYNGDESIYSKVFMDNVISGTVTQEEFDRNTQARSES